MVRASTFVVTAMAGRAGEADDLAHFRAGESYFEQHNFVAAANEFRDALNGGDPSPEWIKIWAHIDLGEIFDVTGQRIRAVNEYALAIETADDTDGAQALAEQRLKEGAGNESISVHHVVADVIRSPEPLRRVNAKYSDEARLAQLEGTVTFTGTVTVDGSVRDLHVLKPLGLGTGRGGAGGGLAMVIRARGY